MNKKKKISIIALASALCVISVGCIYFFNTQGDKNKDIPVTYTHNDSMIDLDNIKEIIGFSDHVFLGEITEHNGNFKSDEFAGESLPYNKYTVSVLENYKGKLQQTVEIKKMGGYDDTPKGEQLVLLGETLNGTLDFLPSVGEKYLFIANVNAKGELVVKYASGNMPMKDGKTLSNDPGNSVKEWIENEIPFERERYKSAYTAE